MLAKLHFHSQATIEICLTESQAVGIASTFTIGHSPSCDGLHMEKYLRRSLTAIAFDHGQIER